MTDASVTTVPAISPADLIAALAGAAPPLVIDARKTPAFRAAPDLITGAWRRDPEQFGAWSAQLPRDRDIVVYCVHGHQVSQGAAQQLCAAGFRARFLVDGIEEGWKAAGGAITIKPVGAATRWVTRARPKIDRIACPWLIARFIDPDAEFLYVPADQVLTTAAGRQALAYDAPGAEFNHVGAACSFDAIIKAYRLGGAALEKLATIVRGADTGHPELAAECAGLLAISRGLSLNFSDDHAMLAQGMVMYDALYAACAAG